MDKKTIIISISIGLIIGFLIGFFVMNYGFLKYKKEDYEKLMIHCKNIQERANHLEVEIINKQKELNNCLNTVEAMYSSRQAELMKCLERIYKAYNVIGESRKPMHREDLKVFLSIIENERETCFRLYGPK